MKQRKEARLKHLGDINNEELRHTHQNLQRIAKGVIRQEKRAFLNRKISKMEEDISNNNSRTFYKEVKSLKGGFQSKAAGFKDKDGNLLLNDRQVQQRWTEHFAELLNQPSPIENIVDEGIAPAHIEGEEDPPSRIEVQAAIKALKNNKAPGIDMLNPEIFKTNNNMLVDELVELVHLVWSQEAIPDDCNTAIIIALHKKGDKGLCSNYRGLSLLTTIYKIIARIVY